MANRVPVRRFLVAAAAAAVLAAGLGACGGSDGEDAAAGSGASTTAADGAAASTTAGAAAEEGDKDDDSASASKSASNPCAVVTQKMWETMFGAGVTKSDASGGPDNCNVLTKGTSPGHEVSFTNFSANLPNTNYDAQLGYNPPCTDGPAKTITGVGDKAVVDTSCLKLSGRAWVITESGGDVFGIFFDAGEPAKTDAAAIESTLVGIAKEALAAR